MRVKIYDYVGADEVYRDTCDLSEAAPDSDDYQLTLAELQLMGRAWVGGGAAPLVLLIRA